MKSKFKPRQNQKKNRINREIDAISVRLVTEDGSKICNVNEALRYAEGLGLDLVEVSPNASPPVCKAIDYQKFLFEQKKNQKKPKNKAIKEIRFGPNTDEHDINFKLKHAKRFLEKGHKLKAYIFFKGRTIAFKERGEILLLEFIQELQDIAKVDQMPKMEGKRMIVLLSPKK